MLSAIIVAAGSSRRMGFDKLLAPLAGHPVLWRSVDAFVQTREVGEIIVVAREDRLEEFRELLEVRNIKRRVRVIAGGAERHLSVWKGLQALDNKGSQYVAIHDGARPLVTSKVIRACYAMAKEHGAACCAAPIPDTVKRATLEQMVQESVERAGLWAMQTPQIFNTGLILQAYVALMAKQEMVTDEVSAVQRLGKKIALIKSADWNFKITFPQDLELAEQVLELRAKKAPVRAVKGGGGKLEKKPERKPKKANETAKPGQRVPAVRQAVKRGRK